MKARRVCRSREKGPMDSEPMIRALAGSIDSRNCYSSSRRSSTWYSRLSMMLKSLVALWVVDWDVPPKRTEKIDWFASHPLSCRLEMIRSSRFYSPMVEPTN